MGATYASLLSRAPGVEVGVIASGERAERLKRDGVVVNGCHFDFSVIDPGQAGEPADLVVVGVKYHGLAEALDLMGSQIGENTTVISLLNGLTSEDEIAARYPQANVLYGITFGVDATRFGSQVKYASPGRIAFGLANNEPPYTPAIQGLAALFDQCGITYEIPADMIQRMWWKFMVNTGVNQVTAILRAPYAIVQQPDSPARELMIAAQREVIAVGQAQGINLTEEDLDRWLAILDGLGAGQYTSMAQDTLANRATETDIFGGAMRRMGAELGIPVPVNTVLHQLLKAGEIAADSPWQPAT
jgi:2-dehydropantoate 2-reductase